MPDNIPTLSDLAALYHGLIIAPDTPENSKERAKMIDELKRRTAELKEKERGDGDKVKLCL